MNWTYQETQHQSGQWFRKFTRHIVDTLASAHSSEYLCSAMQWAHYLQTLWEVDAIERLCQTPHRQAHSLILKCANAVAVRLNSFGSWAYLLRTTIPSIITLNIYSEHYEESSLAGLNSKISGWVCQKLRMNSLRRLLLLRWVGKRSAAA